MHHSHSGEIYIVESTDNGQTWSEERLVMSSEILIEKGICTPELPVEARDPNFALLNDGTVILTFFTRRYTTDSFIKVYMMESKDGGETWGDPILIPCQTLNNWCAKRGNIAVFNDDEILVPVYGGGENYPQETAVNILGKRNENGEWEWIRESVLATTPELGTRINEVSLIATGEDTVYALARQPGYLWKSEDRGITWEICGTQGELHQPGLIKVDDNRVFCTWSRPTSPRPIYGKMFYLDQGWEATKERLIYRYPHGSTDMGDPSAVLTNDGKLLTIYYVTALQIIGGTFSNPSDWGPFELSGGGEKWILFEDNFDDYTEDIAYPNPYFTHKTGENRTITVKKETESDNKFIQFYSKYTTGYQKPEIRSKSGIEGSYTAQFDFRFNEATPTEGDKIQEMYIYMQNGVGSYPIHLSLERVILKNSGTDAAVANKELSPGLWYTFKSVRCSNGIYIKVWEKGKPEPDTWDIEYHHSGIGSAAGLYTMSYITSSTSGQTVDIDNIIISKQIEIILSHTSLEKYEGFNPVQIEVSIIPAQANAPIIWTSSDEAVATVEDGFVNFISPGTATITAKLGNIEKTCTVTVLGLPFEISKNGEPWIYLMEDFEDDTADDSYTNENDFILYTSENSLLNVKSDNDNNYLQIFSRYTNAYNSTEIRTRASTSGEYTVQFDFRFEEPTPKDGLQVVYIRILHGSGSHVMHLTDTGLLIKDSSTLFDEVKRDFTPGEWFTFKGVRLDGRIYAKVWPKGTQEPEEWDIECISSGVSTDGNAVFRMYYISSSTSGQAFDVDNLIFSKRVNMTLSSTEINAKVSDDDYQLDVIFEPDVTLRLPTPVITWSSDNPSVATVNNGLVSFKGAGTATITATLGNITKSCIVNVESGPELSDEEAVAEDKALLTEELIKGNNTNLDNVTEDLNLVTSISGGAGCTISWTSSNEAVIATDGKVTRPEEGNVVVTLTATITKGAVSDTKVFNVTVKQGSGKDYILFIGSESSGGAGYIRTITVSGDKADDLAGKYLVVQFTEGAGVDALVSVIMVSSISEEVTVSYQTAGTKVEVWLTSGMPDLVGEDMSVTVYANAST